MNLYQNPYSCQCVLLADFEQGHQQIKLIKTQSYAIHSMATSKVVGSSLLSELESTRYLHLKEGHTVGIFQKSLETSMKTKISKIILAMFKKE